MSGQCLSQATVEEDRGIESANSAWEKEGRTKEARGGSGSYIQSHGCLSSASQMADRAVHTRCLDRDGMVRRGVEEIRLNAPYIYHADLWCLQSLMQAVRFLLPTSRESLPA